MPTLEQLRELQAMPLERKYQLTVARVMEFYQHFDGEVRVSFSGGKDSTVLLDIVRGIYPDTPADFYNTGVEFPEIVQFVKTVPNVNILRPEKSFRQCLKEYGYPVVNKFVSREIRIARNTPDGKVCFFFKKYLNNPTLNDSKYGKFAFLMNAPFKTTDKCCDELKKKPFKKWIKENNFKGGVFIGTTCEEGKNREKAWLSTGCNTFETSFKYGISRPLSFWTEQDILEYIKRKNLPINSVYGEIVEDDGKLHCTGQDRTGCMFCLFSPINKLLTGTSKLLLLRERYPKLYDYAMKPFAEGGLGYRDVLNWLQENYVENMKLRVKRPERLLKYLEYKY